MRRTLPWVSWVISVALGAAGIYLIFTMPASVPPSDRAQGGDFVYFILLLEFATLGAFLASRRESNRMGWMASGIGLGIGLAGFGRYYSLHAIYGHLRGGTLGQLASNLGWDIGVGVLATYFPLLYPNGRLLSPRWRPVAFGAAAGIARVLIADTVNTLVPSFGAAGIVLNAGSLVMVAVAIAAVVSLVLRYRGGDPIQRLQLKWFLAAASACGATLLIQTVILNNLLHIDSPVFNVFVAVVLLALPATVALAVLKYRLYDIDVVINRAVVYGGLAAFISAVYIGIVVGAGTLVGSHGQPNLLLSIVATAVVAVAFQPVRERVQHLANRLVYGKRATPYEVMAQFSARMSETLAPDEVLPRMAEAAARGVSAQAARVAVLFPDGSEQFHWWPGPAPDSTLQLRVPVAYGEQKVGEIAVAKPVGAPLTSDEAKLLADLAAQAGLVLHNIRLSTDLRARLDDLMAQAVAIQASRQRLVSAGTTERNRLEQAISQGTEAELRLLAVRIADVEEMLESDPGKAAASLDQLTSEVQRTLDGLRRLAHGLYPPLLRDKGLLPALQSQIARDFGGVAVEAENVGRHPAEIEAAVYFCCLEAVRAAGPQAAVRLRQTDSTVEFVVGGAAHRLNGREQDMEDRIEAIGGKLAVSGSSIIGRIPISAPSLVRAEPVTT